MSKMRKSLRISTWMMKATTALFVAEAVLCVPTYVNAASAAAGASVVILAPPSVLGALSVFKVSIINPTTGTVGTKARAQQGNGSGRVPNFIKNTSIQPAVFSISGQANQSFSIVLPQPGVSITREGSFEIFNLSHNAGSTPTIGASGSKVFAVGARVKFTPNSVGSAAKKTQAVKQTPAQKTAIPARNPFGVQGIEDGFLNVLISYN